MKKILSILLTVCLIAVTMSVCIFPVSVLAKDTETELIPMGQQETPDFETISVGETKTAVISEAEETVSYKFTPEEDGIYFFYSVCEYDTYGYLCDEEMEFIAEDDDGGDFCNFMICCPLTAGTTYILSAYFLDSELIGEFDVSVMKSPIKSLEINDVSIIEYSEGYLMYDEQGQEYFNYYYEPSYTVTLTNGEIIDSDENNCVEIDGLSCYLSYEDNQYEEHWTKGNTYHLTGNLCGTWADFDVTITENPIKSIEIDDVTLTENGNGVLFSIDEETKMFYYVYKPTYKVILNDGSEINSDSQGGVTIGEDQYFITLADSQYEEPWQVGNTYTATGELLGITDTFDITISSEQDENTALVNINVTSEDRGLNLAVVELLDEEETEIFDLRIIAGSEFSSNYVLENNQNYLIRIMKEDHVTRDVPVELGTENITIDAELRLPGDLNGNGTTDKLDLIKYKKHFNKTDILTGYDDAVGDLNGSGTTDKLDLIKLKKHLNKSELLY